MKSFLVLVIAILTNACVHAREGSYYRAWQGFSKTTSQEMMPALPSFMTQTIDLYSKNQALSNYLVILPPANSPAYIPHELALVALTEEADYRRIRQTEEGQAYSAAHWDVFDRGTSSSATMLNFRDVTDAALTSNTAYNVFGNPIDWSKGVNFIFIGIRKDKFTTGQFLRRLKAHVSQASSVMGPKGMRGYIVIANDNYEIAYMNWESAEAREQASKTAEAQAVFADARDLMNVLMSQPTKAYQPGSPVTYGEAYHAF